MSVDRGAVAGAEVDDLAGPDLEVTGRQRRIVDPQVGLVGPTDHERDVGVDLDTGPDPADDGDDPDRCPGGGGLARRVDDRAFAEGHHRQGGIGGGRSAVDDGLDGGIGVWLEGTDELGDRAIESVDVDLHHPDPGRATMHEAHSGPIPVPLRRCRGR